MNAYFPHSCTSIHIVALFSPKMLTFFYIQNVPNINKALVNIALYATENK